MSYCSLLSSKTIDFAIAFAATRASAKTVMAPSVTLSISSSGPARAWERLLGYDPKT